MSDRPLFSGEDPLGDFVMAVADGVAIGIRQALPDLERLLAASSAKTGGSVAAELKGIARQAAATARNNAR